MSTSIALGDLEGGSKSWKPEMGDKIQGVIVNVKRVSQTDFQTGEPLTWADGTSRLQTVIEIQTELSDSDDDDGVRTIWLKGGKSYEAAQGEGTSGEVALADAAKLAGATSIDEGAKLTFGCTGIAKPTTRGYQPAKLYRAKYKAPVQSVSTADLFDDDDA